MKKRNKKEAGKTRKRRGSSGKIKQETIDLLIENSIALQKKLTDLAVNVDRLSRDVAQMLGLFREASKAFTEGKGPRGPPLGPAEPAGELREKLDILIDQSKAIAKGLVLLESYIKEKISPKEEEEEKPKPLPQFKF